MRNTLCCRFSVFENMLGQTDPDLDDIVSLRKEKSYGLSSKSRRLCLCCCGLCRLGFDGSQPSQLCRLGLYKQCDLITEQKIRIIDSVFDPKKLSFV